MSAVNKPRPRICLSCCRLARLTVPCASCQQVRWCNSPTRHCLPRHFTACDSFRRTPIHVRLHASISRCTKLIAPLVDIVLSYGRERVPMLVDAAAEGMQVFDITRSRKLDMDHIRPAFKDAYTDESYVISDHHRRNEFVPAEVPRWSKTDVILTFLPFTCIERHNAFVMVRRHRNSNNNHDVMYQQDIWICSGTPFRWRRGNDRIQNLPALGMPASNKEIRSCYLDDGQDYLFLVTVTKSCYVYRLEQDPTGSGQLEITPMVIIPSPQPIESLLCGYDTYDVIPCGSAIHIKDHIVCIGHQLVMLSQAKAAEMTYVHVIDRLHSEWQVVAIADVRLEVPMYKDYVVVAAAGLGDGHRCWLLMTIPGGVSCKSFLLDITSQTLVYLREESLPFGNEFYFNYPPLTGCHYDRFTSTMHIHNAESYAFSRVVLPARDESAAATTKPRPLNSIVGRGDIKQPLSKWTVVDIKQPLSKWTVVKTEPRTAHTCLYLSSRWFD